MNHSHQAIEDFRSKIRSYNSWNAYELKTCLVKYSDSDPSWKIGFVQVQLLEKTMPPLEEDKLDEKRLKLIREIRDISTIDTLLDELKQGKSLTLSGINGSLELMTGHIVSEPHDRRYTAENYKVDYPAEYLIGNGTNSKEFEQTKYDLGQILGRRNPPLRDLHHSCDALLGIDFGAGSSSPFLLILAPLQFRIDTANLDESELRVTVRSSPASEISSIRLVAIGVNEKDKPTEFRHSITSFQPLAHHQELFAWTAKPDDSSFAIRLTLYHKDKKLEDMLVQKSRPPEIDVGNVTRVKIADVLSRLYNDADEDSGEWLIPRFNSRTEEVFGERAIADHPIDGKKQLRGYTKGLPSSDLWRLLQYLVQEDGIEKELAEALEGSGVTLAGGELVRTADIELGVYKTNEVVSELQKLRWQDVAKLLQESANALASNDPISASSKAGLAFDSVAKKALSIMGYTSNSTLGVLSNELIAYGIAENDLKNTLQSLANLRNIQGGHSGPQGKINFSADTAYVCTYLSRVCIGYILKRLHALGKI